MFQKTLLLDVHLGSWATIFRRLRRRMTRPPRHDEAVNMSRCWTSEWCLGLAPKVGPTNPGQWIYDYMVLVPSHWFCQVDHFSGENVKDPQWGSQLRQISWQVQLSLAKSEEAEAARKAAAVSKLAESLQAQSGQCCGWLVNGWDPAKSLEKSIPKRRRLLRPNHLQAITSQGVCVCGKPWINMYAIQCKFKGTAHANCCLHAMRSWHKGHLTSNLGHPTIASLSKWVGTLPTMCQDSKKKFLKAYWTPEYHWVFGGYSMASCAGWWSHKSQWWDCNWW